MVLYERSPRRRAARLGMALALAGGATLAAAASPAVADVVYANGDFVGGACAGASSPLESWNANAMTSLDPRPPNHPLKIQEQTTPGPCAGGADPGARIAAA